MMCIARRPSCSLSLSHLSVVAPNFGTYCDAPHGTGSAYNWESLEETGITHIVSAARSARMNYSVKIHYKRVAIADDNTEESPEQVMDMFLSVSKYIDAAIRSCGKVLVHDWEGAGRSSVFIMAYLMKSRNISYERALEVVRTTRSIV